jgi:hypothetical protein
VRLLSLFGQNLTTTRDHIGYLLQLGLLERRAGRALRVALSKVAGEEIDRRLAEAGPLLRKRPAAQPGRVQGHWLLVRRSGEPDREVPLRSASIVLGRAAGSDVVLSAIEVSRTHCRIELADGRVMATDLDSTNGTLLDAQRIEGTAALSPGSVLRIGPYSVEYHRSEIDPDATMRAEQSIDK